MLQGRDENDDSLLPRCGLWPPPFGSTDEAEAAEQEVESEEIDEKGDEKGAGIDDALKENGSLFATTFTRPCPEEADEVVDAPRLATARL